MANTQSTESWAIPLLVAEYAIIIVGVIMSMAVILMN
jgi:hypothetical protein